MRDGFGGVHIERPAEFARIGAVLRMDVGDFRWIPPNVAAGQIFERRPDYQAVAGGPSGPDQ